MAGKRACSLWLVALLAVTVVALAGCSDDNGSTGGGDTADSDVADDAPAGDSDGDDQGTGDVAPDVTSDTAEDVVADVVSDVGDDAADDAGVDTEDETGLVDVPDDLGTKEFPICPYETASATADCAALCGAVGTCSGEEAETFCLVFCATAMSILNQASADALSTCLTTTPCGDVPEGQDLGGFCFVGIIAALPANPDAVAACDAVDAAIETCTGGDSTFDAECGAVAPALRSDADENILDCASEACVDIQNCVSAAVCDILL